MVIEESERKQIIYSESSNIHGLSVFYSQMTRLDPVSEDDVSTEQPESISFCQPVLYAVI
jgi:hypothetical protein